MGLFFNRCNECGGCIPNDFKIKRRMLSYLVPCIAMDLVYLTIPIKYQHASHKWRKWWKFNFDVFCKVFPKQYKFTYKISLGSANIKNNFKKNFCDPASLKRVLGRLIKTLNVALAQSLIRLALSNFIVLQQNILHLWNNQYTSP